MLSLAPAEASRSSSAVRSSEVSACVSAVHLVCLNSQGSLGSVCVAGGSANSFHSHLLCAPFVAQLRCSLCYLRELFPFAAPPMALLVSLQHTRGRVGHENQHGVCDVLVVAAEFSGAVEVSGDVGRHLCPTGHEYLLLEMYKLTLLDVYLLGHLRRRGTSEVAGRV